MPATPEEAVLLAGAYARAGITEILLILTAGDPVAQAEQAARSLPRLRGAA
jgi:hypothetical protein